MAPADPAAVLAALSTRCPLAAEPGRWAAGTHHGDPAVAATKRHC